jgi:hypothetical protein
MQYILLNWSTWRFAKIARSALLLFYSALLIVASRKACMMKVVRCKEKCWDWVLAVFAADFQVSKV